MTVVHPRGPFFSVETRGTFGLYKRWLAGELTWAECLALNPAAGIYVKRRYGNKRVLTRLVFYRPSNPQTEAQQARRSVFAQAVAEWQGLTLTERKPYDERAKALHLSGYNLFIREWMGGH